MALVKKGINPRELTLPPIFAQLLQAQKEIMAFDLARSLAHERRCHADELSMKIKDLLASGDQISLERHHANLQLAHNARAMLFHAFGEHEVLLVPSAIGEAPATLKETGDPVFGRVWTLLGCPCVHLPFYKGRSGLPVGLQVVGRHGEDKVVLRIAKWLAERLQ